MKSCAGCWYFPNRFSMGAVVCRLTGEWVSENSGKACKAHRPRELGEPFQVVVDVPEPTQSGYCYCECWLFWFDKDGQPRCNGNYATKDGKPGPGCPRWKGEGNG